jgi:VCBS repeat-containing protein
MTALTPNPGWDSVPELELNTQAIGGPGGAANTQAQALLNRTEYLFNLVTNGTPFSFNDLVTQLVSAGFNRPPVAHTQSSSSLDSAFTQTGNLIADDYDPDAGDTFYLQSVIYNGSALTLGETFATAYGSMLVDTLGSWTYTLGAAARALRAGQVVNELFTYTIADGKGGLGTKTLTVTITGTDSVPVVESVNGFAPLNTAISGNVLYRYAFAWEPLPLYITQFIVAGVAGTHAPGDTVTIPSVGTITIASNGDFTFTPVTNWFGPVPLITYTVSYGGPTANGYLTLAIDNLINTGLPLVLYTDFVSGPISGGEDGLGAYLSIFGKNFGDGTSLGTNTKVFIGGVEVSAYVRQDNAVTYAKSGVQRIVVRPGPLGGATPGVPIPIIVQVSSVNSNADCHWTPNPGRILYVSLTGNDSTAVPDDINHPWRTLQSPTNRLATGAYSIVRAGDQVVVRGGEWNDIGYDTCWMRFRDTPQQGYAPNGTSGTGWINITSYPGETVHYTTPAACSGGIQGAGQAFSGTTGDFVAVANIHFENSPGVNRDAAPVNVQYSGGHWRAVNNEIGPWPAGNSAVLNGAGVSGAGNRVEVLGNLIHDIDGTSELQNHGIYADATAYGWEVAYNWIHDIRGGSLVQFNDSDGTTGIAPTPEGVWPGFVNIRVHHNWLEVCAKYGINVADSGPTGAGTVDFQAWNNIIIGTGLPALRLNTNTPTGTVVYAFNTIYDCARTVTPGNAMVRNDGNQGAGHSVLLYNNIICFGPNTTAGSTWMSDTSGQSSGYQWRRNLYYAGTQTPPNPATLGDTLAIVADPKFNNPSGGDFSLQSSSPAVNAGTQPLPTGMNVFDDYTSLGTRKLGGAPDVGALEYPDPKPYVLVPPTTSGGPQVGVASTVNTGSWGNSPTSVTVQWSVGGADVPGATSTTYTPSASDVRQTLRVTVTATNAAGSTAYPLTLGTIAQGAGGPVNTVAPTISGTASVGSVLTVTDNGTWTGSYTGFAYQWQRGGADIPGATASTYTLQNGDAGLNVACEVFALNSTTGSGVAASNSIGPIAAAAADPVVVQHTGKFVAAGSDTVTLAGVTAGNWVLALIYTQRGDTGNATALTDNRGNDLLSTSAAFYVDPSRFRYAKVRDTTGGDYTVSISIAADSQVFLIELTGCDLATFLDIPEVTYAGDRYSGTQTFNIGPTTKAKDLLIVLAGCGGTSATTIIPDGSWTVLEADLVGRSSPASVWSQKLSSVGTFACNFTQGGTSAPYPGPDALALTVRGS